MCHFGQLIVVPRLVAVLCVIVVVENTDSLVSAHETAELFTEQVKLISSDATAGDFFGTSAAISGDQAIVKSENGAYIFVREDANGWRQEAKLVIPAVSISCCFDLSSVSISGDTAVVGVGDDDETFINAGAAFVFVRQGRGTNAWKFVAKLTASDAQDHAVFGHSVAIDRDTVIVGAFLGGADDEESGAAYVFVRQGSRDAWKEVARLNVNRGPNDHFGWSVGISGNLAVVGAPGGQIFPEVPGAAYVFARNAGGREAWGQVAQLIPDNRDNLCGSSIAISGRTVIVGAPLDSARPASNAALGAAYVFERHHGGRNAWALVTKLVASDPQFSSQFGGSVSIDGDLAVIGARGEGIPIRTVGAVYAFARNQGQHGGWGEVQKLKASDGEVLDNFGWSVALYHDTLIVGAAGADDVASEAGKAYVFTLDTDRDDLRDGIDACPRDPLNRTDKHCRRDTSSLPTVDHLLTASEFTTNFLAPRRAEVTATFTNIGAVPIRNPFFAVTEITDGAVLLNGDGLDRGVGATLSPDVGDGLLSPSESLTVSFEIRLRSQTPFQFRVTLHGDPTASPGTPTDGYFEIVSRNSGKCLDVFGASIEAGASVIQWTCHGGLNQQWRLDPASGGTVRIIARHSGQALDVFGAWLDDLAPIIQWPAHDGDNQAWTLEPVGDGHVRIIARHSGKALDVKFASADDGARVIQYTPHGGLNQQWLIRPVSSN